MIPTIHQAILLGFKRIYIPPIDLSLFLETTDVDLIRVEHMKDLLAHLSGKRSLFENDLKLIATVPVLEETEDMLHICFSAIRGHEHPKRALTLAAAGGHHLLVMGPPGCGKSLLADAFHTILPEWNLSSRPPFRSPQHSTSEGPIIGGGRYPKPGEMSLAHRGVLFWTSSDIFLGV